MSAVHGRSRSQKRWVGVILHSFVTHKYFSLLSDGNSLKNFKEEEMI